MRFAYKLKAFFCKIICKFVSDKRGKGLHPIRRPDKNTKTMKATKNNLAQLFKAVNNPTTPKAWRSKWARGVKWYAVMILENFEEWAEFNEANGEELPTIDEATAQNGAGSWLAWAYGGCGLVYDSAICAALCTDSEQRRTDNGARQPNPRETWLDVEARAARQAWALIAREVARLEA